jgi:hypothetical protein
MLQGDAHDIPKHGEAVNHERRSAQSKKDFIRWAGIGPELAEFVTAFVENPGSFDTIPLEKRRDIEDQMDAVLSRVSSLR